jgi:hypothetical protein
MRSQFIARFVKLTLPGTIKPAGYTKPYYTAVLRSGYIDGSTRSLSDLTVVAPTHENIIL